MPHIFYVQVTLQSWCYFRPIRDIIFEILDREIAKYKFIYSFYDHPFLRLFVVCDWLLFFQSEQKKKIWAKFMFQGQEALKPTEYLWKKLKNPTRHWSLNLETHCWSYFFLPCFWKIHFIISVLLLHFLQWKMNQSNFWGNENIK